MSENIDDEAPLEAYLPIPDPEQVHDLQLSMKKELHIHFDAWIDQGIHPFIIASTLTEFAAEASFAVLGKKGAITVFNQILRDIRKTRMPPAPLTNRGTAS